MATKSKSEPNKFNLEVGRVLYNNADGEIAQVTEKYTLDLKYPEDQEKLAELKRRYRAKESDPLKAKFIPLSNEDDSDRKRKRYAYIIRLGITDGRREGDVLIYAYYTNSENFNWSFDPSNLPKRLDTNKEPGPDTERRDRIDPEIFIRLPLAKYSVDGDEGERLKFSAAKYWQPFFASPRTGKAVDQIKPSNISGLANADIAAWNIANYNIDQIINKRGVSKQSKFDEINAQLVHSLTGPKNITYNNIQKLILGSRARITGSSFMKGSMPGRKKTYLAELLAKFGEITDNPRKIYPIVIVDDTTPRRMMTKYGIHSSESVAIDFFEVIHPIAVISGNVTGNAKEMILSYLGAKSFRELRGKAVVSYGATSTEQLVDSYIYNVGDDGLARKLMISSKGGGGAAAKITSLGVAYNEIENNPAAAKYLREFKRQIDNDENYKNAWSLIEPFTEDKTTPTKAAVDSIISMYKNLSSTDIKVLNDVAGRSEDEDSEDLDESPLLEDTDVDITGISSLLKNIMKKGQGKNNVQRIRTGCQQLIFEYISDPEIKQAFSSIVCWLFNHSATVQVNTQYTRDNSTTLTINNLVATWPSQAYEKAELVMAPGGLGFKISINGYIEPQSTGLKDRPGTGARDPDATKTNTTDWMTPDELESGKLRKMNKLDSVSSRAIDKISWSSANLWKWSGAPYTRKEMIAIGIDEKIIDTIVDRRQKIIREIEKELKQGIAEGRKKKQDTQEKEQSTTDDSERADQIAKSQAKNSLIQLRRSNPTRYQEIAFDTGIIRGIRLPNSTVQQPLTSKITKSKTISQGIISDNVFQKIKNFLVQKEFLSSRSKSANNLFAKLSIYVKSPDSWPPDFKKDFVKLLNEPDVLKLISSETKKLKQGDIDLLNTLNESVQDFWNNKEILATVIASLYWAWLAATYRRQENIDGYRKSIENLRTCLNAINTATTEVEKRKHSGTINTMGRDYPVVRTLSKEEISQRGAKVKAAIGLAAWRENLESISSDLEDPNITVDEIIRYYQ